MAATGLEPGENIRSVGMAVQIGLADENRVQLRGMLGCRGVVGYIFHPLGDPRCLRHALAL